MADNISQVVFQSCCLGCGTCVHICPHKAIQMYETPGGLLWAKVNGERCTQCGLCLDVCSGIHLKSGLLPQSIDPFKGHVLSAYCGRATDSDILKNGQSGGIATALLCYLLDAGDIDKTLVTQMPQDGSLRPVPVLTDDKDQIYKAQGSKYCPVPLNAYLPHANECDYSKIAVVGLPCHFHGICNIAAKNNYYERPLLIGLICERVMSFAAMEYLVKKSALPRPSIAAMRYKDKSLGGWPGNINITSKDNKTTVVGSHHRMWCKSVFTPPRCYLCFDKMNVLSDIVLGDAWGVNEDRQGTSVILARTERGQQVIEKARRSEVIQVETIDPELIFKGQHIETKRKDWTAFTAVWQQMGDQPPNLGIQPKWRVSQKGKGIAFYHQAIDKALKLSRVSSRRKLLQKAHLQYFTDRIRKRILKLKRAIL